MPWQQFEDAFKHRLFRGEIPQGKKLRESTAIEAGPEPGKLQQSLDFRSKGKAVAIEGVIERLNSQAIARAEKFSGTLVPDGKCEHPSEVMDTVFAILFIQMQDRFRVTATGITMASLFQLWAEIGIVVDFTVEDDPDCAVFIRHRLMPTCDIHDAEPAERHRQRP